MKTYTQLSQDERYFISSQRARHISFRQIARDLGRATSTVTREYKRNLRPSGWYAAFVAQSYTNGRRRRSRSGLRISRRYRKIIIQLLRQEWSPEQISDYLKHKEQYFVSFQTIYRWIKKDRRRGGSLFKNLRIVPKRRRKRYRSKDSRGVLAGKRLISERPAFINDRSSIGHWEGDTVMGTDKHQCILTLVERKTGMSRMAKLSNRTAQNTNNALLKIISTEPNMFKSITFDNGTEFHSYKEIEKAFPVTCYFANPHHPWERGSVENFNGLLRQYFPKGTSLSYVGNKRLELISNRINSRPRKRLKFVSPKEMYYE
jgi:transposase, IS30 family